MKKEKSKKDILLKAKVANNEFLEFLKEYSVIQLAIGVVIGSAVKELVSSLANNVIMPLIGIFTPSGTWRDIAFSVAGSEFKVGLLISSLIDFIIVALIVFLVAKKILKVEIKK
jgi:large conductance mechanosensitive channel